MRHLLPLIAIAAALTAAPQIPSLAAGIQMVSEQQEIQLGSSTTRHRASRRAATTSPTRRQRLRAARRQKLAAVADRPLPYEFVVLNSGELNAWALPGGKIAINRGLLAELKNEAELAAVLSHEIVHAAGVMARSRWRRAS